MKTIEQTDAQIADCAEHLAVIKEGAKLINPTKNRRGNDIEAIMKNETFKKKAIRHGEVVVIPIDALPEGIEQVYEGREFAIAHSETGHDHVAVTDSPTALTVFKPVGADDGTLFLKVSKDSRIEHKKAFDQHETKTLFKGLYQITIKKAYDYFAKRLESVRD